MAKPFLICIDSDGCVFDTMEIKHKECFCPAYINYFGLQPVSKYAREAWDFSNLYSASRGIHRLLSLLNALDLLSERFEVREREFSVPSLPTLREYVKSGKHLSNEGLEAHLAENGPSEEIENILAWSRNVNDRISEMVHGVPPFPYVRENLKELSKFADIVIVSATPKDALEREWAEHDLISYVRSVKGQESGSKREIIASLRDQYAPDHVLMIGDAPGDHAAAKANDVLFYPICPDREAQSWKQFCEDSKLFLQGQYRGAREDENIAHFETLLPNEPNWRKI